MTSINRRLGATLLIPVYRPKYVSLIPPEEAEQRLLTFCLRFIWCYPPQPHQISTFSSHESANKFVPIIFITGQVLDARTAAKNFVRARWHYDRTNRWKLAPLESFFNESRHLRVGVHDLDGVEVW